MAKLSDPKLYFQTHTNHLVIIDERRHHRQKVKQFLLLGSVSKELLKYSLESLAGRIIYTQLCGFNIIFKKLEKPDILMIIYYGLEVTFPIAFSVLWIIEVWIGINLS
ncbi:hypothetical protein [Rickettsia canadensis]|uniref:Uncharacterized protein n=1 Tax=Rickettsia canadensis str. CA410 TaxID=1105107 RepID=A0ABN4AH55_RICCA|nr:hypothetical protein [Rickettsia canadensis]AFB21505.1 hypothetical protein RCA_04780 [Rickettsia canadensis str. CA410]